MKIDLFNLQLRKAIEDVNSGTLLVLTEESNSASSISDDSSVNDEVDDTEDKTREIGS